ncbi:MAG TPA: 23S rRNA (adenine(2503)-C(2))-methyltransferase RlmN [Candidatus Aphodovivens avistercoris]|nr:23S rRNA (adenine(2503)-C(2))-methyltransferase RlmN [Candidatus Aphodovivens avistercoris]
MASDSAPTPLTSLTREQLKEALSTIGQPSYRSDQIIRWLYQRGASSYDQMTDLPKSLREQLAEIHPLQAPSMVDRQISSDGTRKYLLSFSDGALVETVGIPSRDNRLTVCFSTQVGCPMGCVFCATGYEGFTRNLSCGEILQQLTLVQDDFGQRITNLVAMGQGEPFLNFDAVAEALAIANSKKGLNIGARKITVSTCGIISGIQKFAEIDKQYTMAVSLHAARQSVRDLIMPHAASQPLAKLKQALIDYLEATNRRVTIEYTLIDGMNDSDKDLSALLSFLSGLLCHVNLIPLNKVEDSPFQPSHDGIIERWLEAITARGVEASVRHSKGQDIFGACGQLKNHRR